MDDLFEIPPPYTPTIEEVEQAKNPQSGFLSHADLRRWGVPTPLTTGWYDILMHRAKAETKRRKEKSR